jgi:hypothetical protein
VLGVSLVGVAAGLLAPHPWNAIGLFVAVAVFLAAIMDGLLGGGLPGGMGTAIPMTGAERLSVLRRLYRPRSRHMSDD